MCFADSECLTDERERQGGLVTSSNIESSSWEREKKVCLSLSMQVCVCERESMWGCVCQIGDRWSLQAAPYTSSHFPSCTFGQWDVYIDRSHWANHRQGESLGHLSAWMLIPYCHINECILVFEEATEQSNRVTHQWDQRNGFSLAFFS